MGRVFTAEQITTNVSTGETVTFSDSEFDYRYHRMLILGDQSDDTYVTLNNAPSCKFGGTTYIDTPIWNLTVDSGQGVLLFGTKSVKTIF